MTRLVFMGTPDFAVPTLQRLAIERNVIGVVSQPDRPAGRGRSVKPTPVKRTAEALGIPVYQPDSLRSPEALARISNWQPDAIIVAAFGQILPQQILDLPSKGCINVHASLLPRWRGAAPIQHAILVGDKITGVSIMKMDVGMDTGPVYVRDSISIAEDETAAGLHDKLSALGADVLAAHIGPILEGRIRPEPQDESLATYAPQIKKEKGQIDWIQAVGVIDRQIRAMTPWPGAFSHWNGLLFKIISGRPYLGKRLLEGKPGEIRKIDRDVIVVAGEGALVLLEVQLAGKKIISIEDFIHGRADFIGSSFEV